MPEISSYQIVLRNIKEVTSVSLGLFGNYWKLQLSTSEEIKTVKKKKVENLSWFYIISKEKETNYFWIGRYKKKQTKKTHPNCYVNDRWTKTREF